MIKILIVDDESIKERAIRSYINDSDVFVEVASSINAALEKIRNEQFDLAIIDMKIPENSSTIETNTNGGITLIERIKSLKSSKKPKNIICITSDKELLKESTEILSKDLIPILLFDLSDDFWKDQLKNKIQYLNHINSTSNKFSVDIAIITAVDDEFNSLKNSFEIKNEIPVEDDPSSYFLSEIMINDVCNTVLLVKLPEMGMTAASNITTKVIKNFSPQKVFMVGICGGVKGKVDLGDLIVASQSWDYGSGKIITNPNANNKYYLFEAEPNVISINPNIKDKMDNLSQNVFEQVVNNWNNENKSNTISPKLHISPMPSGSSVISDDKLFKEIIKPQNRKCCGIDMETYGIYYAVKNSTNKNIDFLSIKGVSDFADQDKNDDYHEKCCYLSVNFLKLCLENGIL